MAQRHLNRIRTATRCRLIHPTTANPNTHIVDGGRCRRRSLRAGIAQHRGVKQLAGDMQQRADAIWG
jgi:hypothetical protein